jgi:hypothetical protein
MTVPEIQALRDEIATRRAARVAEMRAQDSPPDGGDGPSPRHPLDDDETLALTSILIQCELLLAQRRLTG